ncbi:MAG: type II CAAX endopeptidase family protein [Anaerolineales bacterium]|jgi:membrane protease YdiL (CAAX protease family)
MKTSLKLSQSTSTSRNLQEEMRKHPLFSFFLMSYAFTWIVLIPYILSVWGIISGNFDFLYIIKPFVGPTLAAIIMTRITEGKEGLHRLRQRLAQRRAGWQWYLLILVGIPALILLGIVIQPGMLASFQGLTPRLLVTYPLYFAIVFFGVALPEEIGWRGFALPRMQPLYGPLWGTLLLGVLWSFWHLLFFLTPAHGGGPGTSFTTFLTSFSYFFLMVMAITIIFTWVFNHTGGSIFIANLVHAAIDTPQIVWIPLFLAVDETRLNLASLIAFGVPALLIIILTRGRLGYQPGQENLLSKLEAS